MLSMLIRLLTGRMSVGGLVVFLLLMGARGMVYYNRIHPNRPAPTPTTQFTPYATNTPDVSGAQGTAAGHTPIPTWSVWKTQSAAQQLSDSPTWQTFANQQLSFTYPDEWQILKDEGDFVVLAGSDIDSGVQTCFTLSLVTLTPEDMTVNEVLTHLNTVETAHFEILDEVTASKNEWLADENPRVQELNEVEIRRLGAFTVGAAVGQEYVAKVDSGDTFTVLSVPVVACGKPTLCGVEYIQVNGVYSREDSIGLLSDILAATVIHE